MELPAEGHAEDAVELGGHEGEAGLRHGLGEGLAAHRDAAHRDVIARQEPGQAAGPVVDGELRAVGAVRARLAAVVLVVQHCDTTPHDATR